MEDFSTKNMGEIVLYQTEDGVTKLNVHLQNESVWLSQDQIAELYQRDKSVISRHIRNIFAEGELEEKEVVAFFATTSAHGAIEGLTQTHMTAFYNLDVIISVGYRVKSIRGTQFRQWATKRIHEYIVKGFALDDERLKGNGGGAYWKELLDRIRDIRSSEKVMYRQVLDLYATSGDYNPKAEESQSFNLSSRITFGCALPARTRIFFPFLYMCSCLLRTTAVKVSSSCMACHIG